MTIDRETVIRLAEEANCGWTNTGTEPMLLGEVQLQKFAALVLERGRKPLTDEQIMDICSSGWLSHPIEVARGIEDAHGITNKGSSDAEPS